MAKNNKIGHDGVVRKVTGTGIEVVIESQSACTGCHAKSACGMADVKQKIITAEVPLFPVAPGEKVTVYARLNQAVFFCSFSLRHTGINYYSFYLPAFAFGCGRNLRGLRCIGCTCCLFHTPLSEPQADRQKDQIYGRKKSLRYIISKT